MRCTIDLTYLQRVYLQFQETYREFIIKVGHNIYILAHQLARHSAELSSWMDPEDATKDARMREALLYYQKHTAQIEVGFG